MAAYVRARRQLTGKREVILDLLRMLLLIIFFSLASIAVMLEGPFGIVLAQRKVLVARNVFFLLKDFLWCLELACLVR